MFPETTYRPLDLNRWKEPERFEAANAALMLAQRRNDLSPSSRPLFVSIKSQKSVVGSGSLGLGSSQVSV